MSDYSNFASGGWSYRGSSGSVSPEQIKQNIESTINKLADEKPELFNGAKNEIEVGEKEPTSDSVDMWVDTKNKRLKVKTEEGYVEIPIGSEGGGSVGVHVGDDEPQNGEVIWIPENEEADESLEEIEEAVSQLSKEITDLLYIQKTNNVLILHNEEKILNDVTYKIKDNYCEFNGTASKAIYIYSEELPAGQYTLSVDNVYRNGGNAVNIGCSIIGGVNTNIISPSTDTFKTFTADESWKLRLAIYQGNTVDTHFRIWLNEGDTQKKPIFSDIKQIDGTKLKEQSVKIDSLDSDVQSKINNGTFNFMSVKEFNTANSDMMNDENINVIY